MLGAESYFIKKRKRWVLYRPASHFFFLASLKEMLGAESFFIKSRKRWFFYRPASHFFFLAIRLGNARRSNPTFNILKWTSFWRSILIIGGKGGIRTHVRLPANAFRERPVTTTSVLFHSYFFLAVP